MTIAPEPAPDTSRASVQVPADDAAGRLLAALLAAAGLAERTTERALAETAR
jgi:hypothetical protein